MDSVLLTTPQLAQRLGLATITLQLWRAQGLGIPFVKVGHRVFYHLADVQRYEQRQMRALTSWLLATDKPLPHMRAMARAAGVPLHPSRKRRRSVSRMGSDDDFTSSFENLAWQPFEIVLPPNLPPGIPPPCSPALPQELT